MATLFKSFQYGRNMNQTLLRSSILRKVLNGKRSYGSALYITGNKAHKTFAYLTPDLDFNSSFANTEKLQKDLDLRGVEVNIKELQKTWEYYQFVESNRQTLEGKLAELSNKIQVIVKKKKPTDEDEKEKEALITQCRLVKQDLKGVKEAAWEFEETLIPQLLKLPNEVDEKTPPNEPTVLKTVKSQPNVREEKKLSHLDIGKNLGLIDYRNAIQCYLCDEAVLFELGVMSIAGDILNDYGIMRVAGPDFCRSMVVEGCGLDHENFNETFMLQNSDDVEEEYLINRLHLVGGASLPALLAMFIKHTVKPGVLPYRIFTTGRQYTPVPKTSVSYGLFSLAQATALQALTLVQSKTTEKHEKEFQQLVDAGKKIFDELDCHYRVVLRSAKELNPWESKRISFEMWSVFAGQYVEVGHVSACGEYFSKRLLIGYQSPTKSGYPSVITGTLISIPRVLGCLLEENPKKFLLPEKVRKFHLFI